MLVFALFGRFAEAEAGQTDQILAMTSFEPELII